MKYYGNPLYHIIATNNKANKIRINHNQPTCKSPTIIFPPNNCFFCPSSTYEGYESQSGSSVHLPACMDLWVCLNMGYTPKWQFSWERG